MADNKINVTVSANTRKNITVSSSQASTEISASADTGRFWAQTAKNWAVSDVIVDNTDYSSKYYANKAKESASNAQGFESAIRDVYNGFLGETTEAIENVQGARDEAVTEVENTRVNAIDSINTVKNEAVDSINSTKTTILNDIELVVDSSISEYTEISNQIKQDNSESSKLAKDWATSEVLVDNIDYSAKYYAEKAKDNSGIFYDELTDEDIDVEILDLNYATKSELELGLDTKQDKGNYALKSEIPSISNLATKDELPTQVSELENDSNYATQTQVLQAIASIPQFKLSIVEELPLAGEKMTLYLVPKEGTNNDVYDEYIWIEQTASYEHLGTTAVDLTDYVKKTDYATTSKAGVIKPSSFYGCSVNSTGYLFASNKILSDYKKMDVSGFVGKGTLENVLTQYSKTVLTTEADYEALETKDSNTLYLIEE